MTTLSTKVVKITLNPQFLVALDETQNLMLKAGRCWCSLSQQLEHLHQERAHRNHSLAKAAAMPFASRAPAHIRGEQPQRSSVGPIVTSQTSALLSDSVFDLSSEALSSRGAKEQKNPR